MVRSLNPRDNDLHIEPGRQEDNVDQRLRVHATALSLALRPMVDCHLVVGRGHRRMKL